MNKASKKRLLNARKEELNREIVAIDKQIKRLDRSVEIMTGEFTYSHGAKVEESAYLNKDSILDFVVKFKINFIQRDNKVICTLTSNDEKFTTPKEFVGIAKCCDEDEFDLATGMSLAQNRAIKTLQEFIISLFEI